jgi:hypothetical protein
MSDGLTGFALGIALKGILAELSDGYRSYPAGYTPALVLVGLGLVEYADPPTAEMPYWLRLTEVGRLVATAALSPSREEEGWFIGKIVSLETIRNERTVARYWLSEKEGYLCASGFSTARLKELWDSYDGEATADPRISGEVVHALLNERGEGRYCAV